VEQLHKQHLEALLNQALAANQQNKPKPLNTSLEQSANGNAMQDFKTTQNQNLPEV